MAILDRGSKIIYTGGNIAWLPYVIQNGSNFYFRYKNRKTISLDTLEQYIKEAESIGYKVIKLEEIHKSFGVEIIEIGKTVALIDGVIIDSKTDSNNIVLSFVKIACELGYCTHKADFAKRKSELRKVKRNITDLDVFLDILGNIKTNSSIYSVKNRKKNRKKNTELSRILEQNGLKYSTYKDRVKRGWDKHKAMTTPPMPAHKSTLKESTDHEGRKFESVEKMVEFHGISKHTFYKRKKEGKTLEECLAPTDQKFNTKKRKENKYDK